SRVPRSPLLLPQSGQCVAHAVQGYRDLDIAAGALREGKLGSLAAGQPVQCLVVDVQLSQTPDLQACLERHGQLRLPRLGFPDRDRLGDQDAQGGLDDDQRRFPPRWGAYGNLDNQVALALDRVEDLAGPGRLRGGLLAAYSPAP